MMTEVRLRTSAPAKVLLRMVAAVAAFVPFPTEAAEGARSITLQADGVPTNVSAAFWVGKELPAMTEISVCLYIKFLRGRDNYDTLISYATQNNTNELYIGFAYPSRLFEVWWGFSLIARAEVNSDILRWWRFCYVHVFTTRTYSVYWNDDVFNGTAALGPAALAGDGIFVLGQDQDSLGGGFAFSQSLNAVLGDFRFYTRAITKQEILNYIRCQPSNNDPQPILDFTELDRNWRLDGSVEVGVVDMSEVCQENSVFFLVFPEKRSIYQSAALCESVGGSLAAPATPKENQLILSSVTPYMQQCLDPSGVVVQLGYKADIDKRIVTYYKNESIPRFMNMTAFNYGYRCLGFHMTTGVEGSWLQIRCEDQICTLCAFHAISRLKSYCTTVCLLYCHYIARIGSNMEIAVRLGKGSEPVAAPTSARPDVR